MGTLIKYAVTFQVLSSSGVYDSIIDVSEFVKIDGIKRVRKGVDSGDHKINAFTLDDIDLNCVNHNGKFNDVNDSRSIFGGPRDLTKVTINYTEIDDTDGSETATITFKGLINEEATRIDFSSETIGFRVSSYASILRTTSIAGGLLQTGDTFETALERMLGQPRITNILTVLNSNINPKLNLVIDDLEAFSSLSVYDAVQDLLIISNSVLVIDSSDNVIIKSRVHASGTSAKFNLFGPNDILRRGNINDLFDYNNGVHRNFTKFVVNNQIQENEDFAIDFGSREKAFSAGSITTDAKAVSIAAELLSEFEAPKIELKVMVATSIVKSAELLDTVSINYPLYVEPADGGFFPLYGVAKYGEAVYPIQTGANSIDVNIGFKIMEIVHDPSKFETELKLRQVGVTPSDGIIISTANTYGAGVYGTSIYA